ncbi:MAG: hypothetical protein ACKOJF_26675, partial [Planctomycetaceae bacterium]
MLEIIRTQMHTLFPRGMLLLLACALPGIMPSVARAQDSRVKQQGSVTPWDSHRAPPQLLPADPKQAANSSFPLSQANRSNTKSEIDSTGRTGNDSKSTSKKQQPQEAALPPRISPSKGVSPSGDVLSPDMPVEESAPLSGRSPEWAVLDFQAGLALLIGLVPLSMVGYGLYYIMFTRRGRLNPFGDMSSGIGPPDERTLDLLESTLSR